MYARGNNLELGRISLALYSSTRISLPWHQGAESEVSDGSLGQSQDETTSEAVSEEAAAYEAMPGSPPEAAVEENLANRSPSPYDSRSYDDDDDDDVNDNDDYAKNDADGDENYIAGDDLENDAENQTDGNNAADYVERNEVDKNDPENYVEVNHSEKGIEENGAGENDAGENDAGLSSHDAGLSSPVTSTSSATSSTTSQARTSADEEKRRVSVLPPLTFLQLLGCSKCSLFFGTSRGQKSHMGKVRRTWTPDNGYSHRLCSLARRRGVG